MPLSLTPDLIDSVKEQVDLVGLFAEHGVELQPQGRYYKGLCPFHADRNPSLVIYPETGIWKCFGCGAMGDAIDFLQRQEGLSFPEAFRRLAEAVGLSVDGSQPGNDYTDLATASMARFDAEVRSNPEGLIATFFRRRGITYQTCRQFWVGLDERGWLALPFFVGKAGEPPVVGFAYRNVVEKEFRVQPDFPRSRFLYPARVEKNEQLVILVEGYFDALSLRSKGYTAYALGSTSISKGQLIRLLRARPREVVVWLDGDTPGENGAQEVVRRLLTAGLRATVITTAGDPDEYTEADVRCQLENRREGALWLAEPVFAHFEQELFRLQRTTFEEVLPLLTGLTDPVEALAFRHLVARRLDVELERLY